MMIIKRKCSYFVFVSFLFSIFSFGQNEIGVIKNMKMAIENEAEDFLLLPPQLQTLDNVHKIKHIYDSINVKFEEYKHQLLICADPKTHSLKEAISCINEKEININDNVLRIYNAILGIRNSNPKLGNQKIDVIKARKEQNYYEYQLKMEEIYRKNVTDSLKRDSIKKSQTKDRVPLININGISSDMVINIIFGVWDKIKGNKSEKFEILRKEIQDPKNKLRSFLEVIHLNAYFELKKPVLRTTPKSGKFKKRKK